MAKNKSKAAKAPRENEEKTYYAKFGQSGKEVTVECVKENGKYIGVHGENIPDWAEITEG